MPEVIRLRRVLQFLELVERVHRFVAEELEELTMEIVRSALGGDGHDASRALPELCRDLSRVYCKFPNRRLAGDRDGFLNALNVHGEVFGVFEADGERDVLDFLGCKPGQLGPEVVASRWNAAETVPPVLFRHDRSDDATFGIRHRNGHTRQNAALRIGDDTGDDGI